MRFLWIAVCWLAGFGSDVLAAPSLARLVNGHIRDFQATATLSEANLPALRKIGPDYANAYRCQKMEVFFKEPDRMRFEMHALGVTLIQVIRANAKYTLIPQLHFRQKMDLTRRPQTRQNSMELGFLTPSALRDFTVRTVRKDGHCLLLELRYRQKDQNKKKILLWVDPLKKVLTRREIYRDDGRLKARFTYLNPKEVKQGIWVPTCITVHNEEGEFGGATHYSHIQVNTGLPDHLFEEM